MKLLSLQDAFVTQRLDYCNILLSGCTNSALKCLQLVQNAAARLLTRTKKFDHISPVLKPFIGCLINLELITRSCY